jgi:hypothetical protein
MILKSIFNKKDLDFIKEHCGNKYDFEKELTDDEICDLDDDATELLLTGGGFTDNQQGVTELGAMCERIIDVIVDNGG